MKIQKWRADIILLAGVVLIGAVFGAVLLLGSHKGAQVRVRTSDEVTATYSLDEDGTYVLENEDGGTNTLVIENGEAYVTEASCPDGICKNMGKISKSGQSIVCLPNKVVIDIIGDGAETQETDMVAR